MQGCPLCGEPAAARLSAGGGSDVTEITCASCGTYKVSYEAEMSLRGSDWAARRYLLSAMTRRASDAAQPLKLLTSNIKDYAGNATAPKTPFEVIDNLLVLIHARLDTVADSATVTGHDYPLLVLRSVEELRGFLRKLQNIHYADVQEAAGKDGAVSRMY
ncbi:MAG: hypothetical protein HYY76_11040 [Acidobacteria bacterium]|nr:hypothetical protein [Acidobacteriota bacterium]